MSAAADVYPPFGLHVVAGPLELRGLTDELLLDLCEVDDFCLDLAVLLDGRVIGAQGVSASSFPVTRTGETGSWLGREFQGRGLGTAMRRAFCELLFDHLGFEEITSGAFVDNPASLAVSRKVGYEPTVVRRLERRDGELVLNQGLRLTPESLVRGDVPVEVTGAAAVRSFIGLAEA